MISKLHRFHGHNSVRSVYQKGLTLRSPFWTLKVANGRYPDYRLAVVVSKKVSKSAVIRNRIRRRLYEAARASSLADTTKDVIITVFSEQVATMPNDELNAQLKVQLDQLAKTTEK